MGSLLRGQVRGRRPQKWALGYMWGILAGARTGVNKRRRVGCIPAAARGMPLEVGIKLPCSSRTHSPRDRRPWRELARPEPLLSRTTAAQYKRWEFLLTAAPLRVVGGTGSPLNPIANY